ncbi:undecaprenyldiphospho-muramoylpentapeptide beta-N-acetylglucosaminyltransferase [bacterium]|nr:undecaprenyldiphospho-muramoylpentapeptide beta-N-acetylglucosaminyltransferase [bacterium]
MSDKKGITYFLSGGGTGGHIYPVISVLERILKDDETEKVYYIGNPKNLEAEILKQFPSVKFLPVNFQGMPRKFGFKFIKWLCHLEISLWRALYYTFKYKPDVVFTTGGYVSAPIAFSTLLTKVPLMIHDCDAQPGLVSKTVAPFAKIVSVAFEDSVNLLDSKNIHFNGNPVREAFLKVNKEEALKELNFTPSKKTVLVMGGSQGAKTINSAVVSIAKALVEEKNVQLIFQTGKKNFEEVVSELKKVFPKFEENKNLIVRPYFDNMFIPLSAADVVISRAGSVSLSEICLSNSPSILIPYPHAAQDHQRKNAKKMVEKGAALYLEDDDCKGENLDNLLEELLLSEERLAEMSQAASKLAKRDGAERILEQLKSIVRK